VKSGLFYILDSRSVVGNCAMFWCPDSKGYTCELQKAGLYSRAEAYDTSEHNIPIAQEDVEALVVKHVRLDTLRAEGLLSRVNNDEEGDLPTWE